MRNGKDVKIEFSSFYFFPITELTQEYIYIQNTSPRGKYIYVINTVATD